MINRLEYIWKWLIARFHLNDEIVCEMSKGRGMYNDFHDFTDSEFRIPWHFVTMKCRRCGKEFYI